MKKVIVALCIFFAVFAVVGCAKDTVGSLGAQAVSVADQYISGKITGPEAGAQLDVITNKLGVLADQARTDITNSASALALKLKVAALKLYITVSGDVVAARNAIANFIGTK
jgi:hypothetical protein